MKRFVLGALLMAGVAGAQAPAWDPEPWVADLRVVREAIEEKYANLDWLRAERDVPDERGFEQAEAAIRRAGDDAGARRVLDRLVTGMKDGHVSLRWPGRGGASVPPASPATTTGPRKGGAPHPAMRGRASASATITHGSAWVSTCRSPSPRSAALTGTQTSPARASASMAESWASVNGARSAVPCTSTMPPPLVSTKLASASAVLSSA